MRIRARAHVDYEDGTRDTFEIARSPVTIGRAPTCDVALIGARRVEWEHARIELARDAVSFTPLATPDETPVRAPYGRAVALGDARITFERIEGPGMRAYWMRGLSAAVAMVIVASLATLVIGRRGARAAAAEDAPGSSRPALFDEDLAASCDQEERAGRRTLELSLAARALREQRAFDVQDGVRAVETFARAAACAEHVGDELGADALRAEGDELRTELEERAARLVARVRRARQREDAEAELTALRSLLELLAHRDDELAQEYVARARTLEAETSRTSRFPRLGR
ncbi:FHA domain-containing protein [Sandaracinus amylolyticus]|uniref:FHA domain-containing protein n=1 Tax=Sandaracinus amylolyticus TaxID=927083 RepID=UPI001F470F15|nr:FHA domain-containing protein [Sandaracinus amylolyticus]UJR83808.1 Hypothetical protein I5071_58790 [Sandaracinus amylolyticus]